MIGMAAQDRSHLNYEPRDVPRRGAFIFGVVFVLSAIALVGGVSWWGDAIWGFHRQPRAARIQWNTAQIPQPRLQIDAPGELKALRARKDKRLDGLGWVDRAHGIVHIPIDRAMAIEAARAGGRR